MKIITRILFFIPVAVIGLFAIMRTYILWMYDFAKYGGEMIVYNKRRNRITIQEVFDKLNENLNN